MSDVSYLADRLPAVRTLPELLRSRARERPGETGYRFLLDGEEEPGHLTFHDLDLQARAIGALLQKREVRGERVLLLYPPGLGYIAAFFGCLYAGAVAVPAYPPRQNRSLPRLRAILADARPRAALTTAAILSRVQGWLEEAPDLGSLHWEATDGLDLDLAERWQEPEEDEESLAFLQYTSGSTGTPKGVVLSHGNLLHNLELMRRGFGFGPESRGVSWLPPYHDMGLIGGILQPLYTGFPVTLMSPASFLQRPLRWLQAISRTRATSTAAPNFAYDLSARRITAEERRDLDLSAWSVAISGAEPVRSDTLERFAAAFAPCGFRPEAFCPSFGLAEATLIVSGGRRSRRPLVRELDAAALERNRVEPPAPAGRVRRLVGCGGVLPGQAVRIVDPESLAPCPPCAVGEVWVAGPSVAQGYWQRAEETKAVFHSAEGMRWLRTGDLGFLDGGELFVAARLKDLIILRGRNLYPQDVELAAERAHPALAPGCGAAFSVEVDGEERLVVVYEAVRGSGLDVESAAAAVRQAVAEDLEAQVFDLVLVRTATIPKTTSGKIQRRACREAYLAGTLTVVGQSTAVSLPPDAEAPDWRPSPRALAALDPGERRPVVEQLLRHALADIARVDRRAVAADVSLGGLGLDSLMTIELKHRLELETGASLSLSELLVSPAVGDLVDLVLARLDRPDEGLPVAADEPGMPDPLSYGQRGLWFLERLAPESGAYNIAGAAQTGGPLDVGALRRALASLLERHPLLRAAVEEDAGAPRLRLRDNVQVDLAEEVIDSGGPSLASRLAAEAYRPFDLARDPLLRVRIFRVEERSVVLLAVHHLVADFWSLAILVRELGVLYHGETAGTPALLPALPHQYAEFVRWQERQLAGAEGERLWAFWRERLAGAPFVLDLPADRPRPPVQGHHGAAVRIRFGGPLSERLRALSAEHGATLYMTLLAAFQLLLHRLTGQRELLVGSATAGRSAAAWADVVGYFVNPLVLRSGLDGGESFRELLARTRRETLEAFEHQDFPFALLTDRLQLARDPSRSPLFQAMLVLQRSQRVEEQALAAFALGQPGAHLDLGGLPLESVGWEERRSRFDLLVTAAEVDGEIAAALEYPLDLFDGVTVQRLGGQLGVLLAAIGADRTDRSDRSDRSDSNACALDLPLLTEPERHQLLWEWNGPAAGPGRPERREEACLHGIFEERAAGSPEAPAVTCGSEQLTYRELSRRANQLARHLRGLGVGPGTLVGLCVERSLDMPVAILGTLKAGGAYVPFDPAYPKDRLGFCLEDSRVAVLVTEERLAASLPGHQALRVCLDTQREILDRESAEPLPLATSPQDPAYVIYTSGSTGRPKGVVVRHANAVRLFAATEECFGFGPDDVWTLFHSYAFDFSVWEIWGAWLYGGRLVVVPRSVSRSPEAFLDLLRRERVTVLNQTPSAFRELVRAEAEAPEGGEELHLRWVIFGGEALELASLAPWLARHGDRRPRLVNMYGITETTVHVTCRPVGREDLAAGLGSVIGRAIPDLRLRVLDARMLPLPAGVPGELYVGGAGVAGGYLGRPELTAERFLPAPAGEAPGERVYRTGDLVRYLPDGDLEYLGRIDQQVKVRGFRIELAEIEAVLARHPAVAAAVVAARPDPAGPARLAAYVVPAAAVTASELHRFVAGRLPDYMVPAAFVFLEALPLTPSGKIDRKALPEPDRSRPRLEEEHIAPRTSAEALLAGIWAGVLGLERVGVRDNFFELGGDSILSLQVVARAGQEGLRITPLQVLQHQTVEELAAVAESAATLLAAADPGPAQAPLSPIQRWFFERELPDLHHYNQAVLLAARPGVRPDRLAAAIEHLVDHHDALRLRFARVDLEWTQAGGGAGPGPALSHLDLASLPAESRGPALEAAAGALQASLDIERGPLLRAAFFGLGGDEGGRLLLVIHHLAVDGVSWRILLEDLERAYRRLEEGLEVALPAATPYRLWAKSVAERAGEDPAPDLAEWLRPRRPPARLLPADGTGGPNTEGSAREVAVALEPAETLALLRGVPRVHRARVDEALLAALIRAFAPSPGAPVRIDVETHGRDEAAGVDLSRAVGWFTAIVPVWLEAAALDAVKEQLRPALERGSTWWRLRHLSPDVPAAEVLFNYLGQLDLALAGSTLFSPAGEPFGALRGSRGLRSHALEVEARVLGGRLRTVFRFSERVCSRSAIERLADRFVRSLREFLPDLGEAGIEDIYPLSPTQQGLLFHSLYTPDSGVYVTQLACELRGELDMPAFEQAWADLLARHAALRTSFSWRDGEDPFQRVHARLALPVAHLDWRGADGGEPERIEELLRGDRERGFDLAAAPLMRLYLVRLAEDRHLLIWSHHHLLLDGWSVAVLVKELFVIYGARRQGKAPRLAPSRPYADFIAWLQAQDLAEAAAFWRGMFAGFAAPTPLGIDRSERSGHSATGSEQSLVLAPDVTDALRQAARRHRFTLSVLLQGAWALLLSRYSGEEQVTFGATFSGRPTALAGVEEMIGLFINTLPVRVAVPAEGRLLPWLTGLQALSLKLLQVEHSPLIEVQQWAGKPAGVPLFDSLVVFENYPVDAALQEGARQVAGLEIAAVTIREQTNYPLTLAGLPGTSLTLRAAYDERRFEAPAVARLLEHLRLLLECMAELPDVPLADLPLLSAAEQHLLLGEWSSAGMAPPMTTPLHRLFEAQVARSPEAVALVCDGCCLSYAELDRRANRLARRLRRLGVGPEIVVALCGGRSLETIVGMLGILKAGGAFLPLDESSPRERLALMIEDARARVLLAAGESAAAIPGAPVLRLDSGGGELAGEDDGPLDRGAGLDHLAYVIYTSGSTGVPKGVPITHENLAPLLLWSREVFGFGEPTRVLQSLSYAFDFGVFEILTTLLFGGTLVLRGGAESHDVESYLQEVRRHGVNTLHTTPSFFRAVAAVAVAGGERLSTLEVLHLGGEALVEGLVEEAFRLTGEGCRLFNGYGPTEAAVNCALFEVGRATGWRPRGLASIPIGHPSAANRLYVLDRGMQPVPVGVAGELLVGGVSLSRGYLGRPALTAMRFVPDPFGDPGGRLYRTGDLVRFHGDGAIEFLGRVDAQVKVRGFRIELEEIEAALAAHPEVGACAVTAWRQDFGEARLVAYVVARRQPPPSSLDSTELGRFLGRTFPPYMVPATFVALPELPVNVSGKVDRKALPAPDWSSGTVWVAPRTPLEELLAGLWRELLGHERVGARDSFFDLGGHSLLATRLLVRVRAALGVDLPLRALFESPTVEGLAQEVERRLAGEHEPQVPPITPVPRCDRMPLSFGQERLWFLEQLEPGTGAYNVPVALRIEGSVSIPALERAFGELVVRHEALRTALPSTPEGGGIQLILPPVRPALPVVDLRGVPAGEAEAFRLAVTEARRPLDFARGPLLRIALLALGDSDHILLLTLHHAICDEWSTRLLVDELGACYAAFAAGATPQLPPVPIQPADHAVWQRSWRAGETLAAELGYWRERLRGTPGFLALPADRPRPPVWSSRGATRRLSLPGWLAASLDRASRRLGVTPFLLTLAAFRALLHKYTGQEDLVLGTPVANRSRLEVERLVGFLGNVLMIRTGSAGGTPFTDLLAAVRTAVLEAHAHQNAPFEKLVEELHGGRDLSHQALFQVLFVRHDAPWRLPSLGAATVRRIELDYGTARFDWTLTVEPGEDDLVASLEYATDLFDATTAARVLHHYARLLEGVAADPAARIEDLPLLGEAERHQLIHGWNDTRTPGGRSTVPERVAARAREHPSAVAVSCEGESLTYGELEAGARRLARHLERLGVGPEVPVAVCLERSPELLVALLGIWKAGGAYVPLDPSYPRERLEHMLADSGAPVLLTQRSLASWLSLGAAQEVCLDAGLPRIAASGAAEPGIAADAGRVAYVIYTSGSTGRPKGVQVLHGALASFLDAIRGELALVPRDRLLAVTSLSFDIAGLELFLPLSIGAEVALCSREAAAEGARLRERLESLGIAAMQATPSTWRLLLDADWRGDGRLKVLCGGEALDPGLARRLAAAGGGLWNLYGPTETTIWSAIARLDGGAVTLGRPLAGQWIHLFDRSLAPVPIGVPGGLYIGGAGLARGYLRRPDLTAERFVPDPFGEQPGARLYATGDLARRLPDGRLDFLGRLDHQVKVRGFRIELGEVEAALARHPGVKQVVVTPHPEGGSLVAYLVPGGGPAPAGAELREHLKRHLPEHSVPSAFVVMEAFPLTPNGKVDRRALPAPDGTRPDLGSWTAPRTPAEEVLAGIFASLLGVDRVGAHDDFFLLGGHSLLAARVAARVREAFGADLPLRRLFEAPTVAGLAVQLGRERAPEAEPPRPVPRNGDLPLSSNQERLWFLDQLDPGAPAYHLALTLRIEGDLDRSALERALAEVADRHESLRTTFPEAGGRPRQAIAPRLDLAVPVVDFGGLATTAAKVAALGLAAAEARRPFDLARGPLLRVLLARLAPAEHLLALTVHHIVSDGWSNQILIRETAALYEAFRGGHPSPLSPLPFQYADYAVWQRRWLTEEEAAAQLAYWSERLGGAMPALELPTDRPRPAVQTSRGGAIALTLPEEMTGTLRAAARAEGCTLFMVLLAAFQTLLSRIAGQTDVAVGSPLANRRWPETEGVIGFFANTLVLRSDLDGNSTFRELLGRVREAALGAYDHGDLPFEKLVEELSPVRDLSRAPLFQVLFALQNAPPAALELPGLALSPAGFDPGVVRFDLELSLEEGSGPLAGALVFNRDLFDGATALRLAGHLQSLLAAGTADLSRRLSDLPLLAEPERHALLCEWSAAPAAVEALPPVHRQFELQAAAHPGAPALVCEDEVVSYGELNRRANRLAWRLRRLGVGPETRVALHAGRSAGLVAGLLGILKAGGAYVPLDPALPLERQAFVLADCGAQVVVSEPRWRDRLPAQAPHVLLVEMEDLEGESGEDPAVAVAPGDLAYVIYTSGSTGRPKGVLVEHNSLAYVLAASRREFGWNAADRMPVLVPFSFDIFLFDLFNPLLVGGCCQLMELHPVLDLSRLVGLLEDMTRINAVPALMRQIVEAVRERGAAPRLRTLFVGGDTVPAELLAALRETFPAAEIRILYGPTEATLICSSHPLRPGEPAGRPLLGRPLEGTVLQVRDGAAAAVPIGVVGEVFVAGPGVARGYLGRGELTAERFPVVDGRRCYRTGDLARWLPDGTLEFHGRVDQQVKIRGFRIELGEIEAVLGEQPEVQEAVVVARDDGGGDRRLVAYLVGEGPALPSAADLRARLAERLPAYMIPSTFVTLEALPLTRHGKVDRRALPPPSEAGEGPPDSPGSQSPVEEILAGLWAQILGLRRVQRGDDFFALGGHSLLATQLASRARDSFRVELPLRSLLEDSTLAGQAARVEAALKEGKLPASPPLQPAPRDGDLPPSFAQERLWFLAQIDPASAAFNIPAALRARGRLAVPALAGALSEVVRRHESLRTAFLSASGRPALAIASPGPLPLPVADLEGLAPDLRDAEVLRLAGEEARLPFDLTKPPLLRARLLRLGTEEHVVLLTVHHIVADGWSIGVLVREVAALYGAFAESRPSPLPELPLQYADFAMWQRRWMEGEALSARLAYWRRQLAGAPDPLELPTDRRRPEVQTFRGAHRVSSLPAGLSRELRALGRREGATLFMTLLAAFQSLLHVWTGQDDVVVGTDVASRDRTELEGLIGFFINHLVLRTAFSGNLTFRELLGRVRETCLGAYAHQDLPFVRLVQELSPRRSFSHMPLFQVLFVLQNAPAADLETAGLQLQPVAIKSGTSRFDLALFVNETAQGLMMDWSYSTELFNPSTIDRLASGLERMLEEVAGQPDTRLNRLELVAQRQKEPKTVDTKPHPESPFKKRTLRRESVDLSELNPVQSRPLLPEQLLPLLVTPAGAEVDLAGWAETHRADLDAWVSVHGAILLRGFGLGSAVEFERCAAAICPSLFADYGDLPREQGGEKIYHSTPYPPDKAILFHNESSHLDRWPLRQMFFCVEAARSGGETPIVDCRQIYRRLDPAIARRFEEKGLMYVRNFTDGLDVNWRDFFHTDDRAAVEESGRRAGMEIEWREDGLTTRQVCPAVTVHPRTGEKIFFNQLQLHHPACLDADVRDSLLAVFPRERLPRNVHYGDGSPIEEGVVREVLNLYWETAVSFPWQPGDLLLLDNMLVAHARNPFVGPRKIVVAMGDLFRQPVS